MGQPKASTVRVGRRYRAKRLDGPYDAIVIGSGPGGLATAGILSKAGKKVLVLDQHYTSGGFTHTYDRNGYEWDVGVHYIGDMGTRNTIARRLFDYLTDGRLQWAEMDDCYDRIVLGDNRYDLMKGKAEFKKELLKSFPDESAAIDEYFLRVRAANKAMPVFTMEKVLPGILATFARWYRKLRLPAYLNQTTYEVLRSLTKNEELIAVLTGQWGDSGEPPSTSSFLIHSLIAKHYFNGGYYPVGGSAQFAIQMIPGIQKNGGEVFTYARIDTILMDGKKAVGVQMADGEKIYADTIVSSAGVFNTFERLLPEGVAENMGYKKKLDTVTRSMAHLGMYIGIKESAKDLGLPKTNYWLYPSSDYDENIKRYEADEKNNPVSLVYVSFPSAKDPSWEERYPGTSTVTIVATGYYEWFEKWKDEPWGKRGDEYEAYKEYFSERLLKVLYKEFPQLEGKIDYSELSTPLSTEFFCEYGKGEIYGLRHDPDRFDQSWLKPKTKIPGLYLTGQDIMSCGVMGAMMGGVATANVILGVKAGKKVMTEMMTASYEGPLLVEFPDDETFLKELAKSQTQEEPATKKIGA